jgi:hypothetical protein
MLMATLVARLVGLPIEGDRRDRIAEKTALDFLDEPGPKWLSSFPHSHGASAFPLAPGY